MENILKYTLLVFCLVVQMSNVNCQAEKSDLRIKVEQIITDDIKYLIDSTTNQMPELKWDTTIQRGLYPSFSSLPPNPLTLIILDGEKVKLEELDKYKLELVEEFNIYPKDDNTAMAIYGTSAMNGLIIINLKE